MERTARDVLLYVPNLIGYARVSLTIASFIVMIVLPEEWLAAIGLYLASFVGDLVDGIAARKLQQTSSFGGVLDMVTDRCSTLGLLFILAGEYMTVDETLPLPVFRLCFLSLMILDIGSHWCQMYSSLSVGQHHKSAEGNADRHFLVRWFYGYYWFFGYLCVGAEFTYILLYARIHLAQGNGNLKLFQAMDSVLAVCVPGCIAKQMVNVMQLSSALYAIADHDAKMRNKGKTK